MSRSHFFLFFALIFLFNSSTVFSQKAKKPGVHYSYQKLTIGNVDQYVLLPKPLPVDYSDDTKANLEMAFSVLKRAKTSTYGNAQMIINTKHLKKGKVTINIDQSKSAYYLIVAAETVYTFAALGVTKVEFPGVTDQPLTIQDIPFGVYYLILPMWRALPPSHVPYALIQLRDGSLISAEEFYKKVKKKDQQFVNLIFDELKSKDQYTVTGVTKLLPELKLANWESKVLPLLTHDNNKIRLVAIQAFEKTKSTQVLDALIGVMDEDEEVKVQAEAARVLGACGKKEYAIQAIYFELRAEDETRAIGALSELKLLKNQKSTPEVEKALVHPSEAVAIEAVDVLNVLKATDILLGIIKNDSMRIPVREAAALALADNKKKEPRFEGLTYLANQGYEEHALTAIEEIYSLSNPKVIEVLIPSLVHTKQLVRRLAADKLAAKQTTDAFTPLSKCAGQFPEDGEYMESAALTIMNTQPLNNVLTYTKNKDPFIKRAAFIILGQKAIDEGGGPKAYDIIVKGVKSKDPGIRGASALALGAYKTDEALEILFEMSKDKEASVRRDTATSLGYFDSGIGSHILIALLKDPEPVVAKAAVLAMGERDEKESLKTLSGMSRHPDPDVRKALIITLPKLVVPKTTGDVISFLSNSLFDENHSVQMLAIETLGTFNESSAVDGISLLLQDPNLEMQMAAILALGNTQHPESYPLIQSVLYNPHPDVRKSAVLALKYHASPEAVGELRRFIESEQVEEIKTLAKESLKSIQ